MTSAPLLDVETVVPFLLERGLIDVAWIDSSSLRIWSEVRSNRNLRIEGPDGRGFLLKQAEEPAGGESLAREAAFCEFCRGDADASVIARFLPILLDHHLKARILVFDLIADARPLQATWWHPGESRVHDTAAKALGHGLAAFHSFGVQLLRNGAHGLNWLPRQAPMALMLHRPRPALLARLSRANLETIRILQSSPRLKEHFDRLMDDWRFETVIHADLRPDNVLVRDPDGLWITVWEMVRIGDPAWDLACAFQGHLVAWVDAMLLSDEIAIGEMTARSELALVDLQDSMRAFWSGYCEASAHSPNDAEDILQRAVRYAVAALVQWAYERAANSDSLPGHAVLALQIAENLAAGPDRGRTELFGLPPRLISS